MTSRTPASVTRLVKERDQGLCRRCGNPGNNKHHRITKGSYGNDPRIQTVANIVTLCGSGVTGCHGWATEDRDGEAKAQGWRIRRNGTEQPYDVPLVDKHGTRFLLTRDGDVRAVESPAGALVFGFTLAAVCTFLATVLLAGA